MLSNIEIGKTVAVTGHRPGSIYKFNELTQEILDKIAKIAIFQALPKVVYTGMALGWDLAIAKACVELDIPFIAVIPSAEQTAIWKDEDKLRYNRLIVKAKEVIDISLLYPTISKLSLYQLRNEYMIKNSDLVIALWDNKIKGGGTFNALSYAWKTKKKTFNVFEEFVVMRKNVGIKAIK